MKPTSPLDLIARVERLERQNSILKIIGLTGLFILSIFFVIISTSAKPSEVVAQKFTLIDPNGKKCGYLGYDPQTKNPRLSLKSCYDRTPEKIGLRIENDSPQLILDASGRPIAALTADKVSGVATLDLTSENLSVGGTRSIKLISGNNAGSLPRIYLDGAEKGRVEIWGEREYFSIQDNFSRNRFSINKTPADDIALHFFANDGSTEIYRVPPKPTETR